MSKLFILFICIYIAWARAQVKNPEKQSAIPLDTPVLTTNKEYFVFSASQLPPKNANGEIADPCIKVYFGSVSPNSTTIDRNQLEFLGVGVSARINDDPNPKWAKVFNVQYTKGTNQKVFVEIRDHDNDLNNPDDIIGEATLNMDQYISNKGVLQETLKKSKSGSVTMKKTKPFLFSLEVKNEPSLDNFDGRSDPGKDVQFFETERFENVADAKFDGPITFNNYQEGTNQFFYFKVEDHDEITGNDDIGEALLDIDSFVQKKMSSVLSLGSNTNATLLVHFKS